MPLVQVDLDAATYEAHHEDLSRAIHEAHVTALGMTPDDLFQVFTPHGPGELKFSPTFNDVDRRSLLLLRITMVHMYPVATKRALFEEIAKRCGEVGVRPEDILVCVTENGFEDWYAGK